MTDVLSTTQILERGFLTDPVYQNIQPSEAHISKTFDPNDIQLGRVVKKVIFYGSTLALHCFYDLSLIL